MAKQTSHQGKYDLDYPIRKRHEWNLEEETLLKTAYPTMTKKELLTLFPRHPWPSILRRAKVDSQAYRRGVIGFRQMNQEEAAWLACAIDSEGTIAFSFHKQNNGSPCVRSGMAVYNTSEEYIRHIKEIVGKGCVSQTGTYIVQDHGHGVRQILWKYSINGFVPISKILEQIYPYVIVKREKARIIMEAAKQVMKNTGCGTPGNKVLFELQREFYWLTHGRGRAQPYRLSDTMLWWLT